MKLVFEYIVAAVLVFLLGLLANPFMLWMPSAPEMMVVLVAAILAVIYAGFVFKERAADEREAMHRMLADRAAFLTITAILVIALVVQGLAHAVDPWIPAALALTIIAKLIARAWASRHQ